MHLQELALYCKSIWHLEHKHTMMHDAAALSCIGHKHATVTDAAGTSSAYGRGWGSCNVAKSSDSVPT